MADNFALTGSYTTTPNVGAPSTIADLVAPIDEEYQLLAKQLVSGLQLNADSPQAVPFGAVGTVTPGGANIIIIKSPSLKIDAVLTSADGTSQVIPVDGFLALISHTVPYTALSLTRLAGQVTTVDVFLGQTA
jgi:hypothetical protein